LTITDTDTGETDSVIKTNYISVVTTGTTSLITTSIVYTYDNLYRLTDAVYSGGITATYEYLYDAAGNRTAYTTTITSTEVITYLYDNANQLVESVVIGGDTTTYTWDNASRLITTTVAGQVSRVYDYSQDGDLITATVDSLVTAFAYDGDGRRLQMSVAGEVTTYTLDYAFPGFRILFEDGPDDDKHYLYGVQCIAEVVDEGTVDEEWRYYQRDGNHMVRQTTNETADVTLAWTYTPEGMVLVGEEGPVTYLDCGTGGIYDWSTGLIFKDGRFFDPTTGIWITLSGVVVYYKVGQARDRRRKSRKGKKRRLLLLLLLIIVAMALAGCGGDSGDATPTPECPEDELPELPTPDVDTYSITLNIVLLNGVNVDWQTLVTYGDLVYDQADVSLIPVFKGQLDPNETSEILSASGNPTTLNIGDNNPLFPTSEELKLIHGNNNYEEWANNGFETPRPAPRFTDNGIVVYFVPSIDFGTAIGKAFLPRFNNPPSVAISAELPPELPAHIQRDVLPLILPHELGHILLDELDHAPISAWGSTDSENFMEEIPTGSKMTDEQIAIIQNTIQENPNYR
jgi:YD repeat-containing protein